MLLKKIIDQIKEGDSPHVLRKEVLHLLNNFTEGSAIEVPSIQRGDVFWYTLVGGKQRPWVALSCRDGLVAAMTITSEGPAPRMVKCECRFWQGYLSPAMMLVEEEHARKYVAHPYTNLDHLRRVEAHMASLFGLRALPGGDRKLDVPDQPESRQLRRADKRKQRKAAESRAPAAILEMNRPVGA